MRKLLVALAIVVTTFSSCGEGEVFGCEPNCGFIEDDGIDGANNYWVTIKNDCTGNVKKWYLSPGDWYNAHPGSDYCITNTDGWKQKPTKY